MAPITIQATDISPKDAWIVAYITSYMFPFASMAIDDFDVIVCGTIATVLVVIILFVNSATPNPLLFLRKYHFYEVGTENGVSGYLLICKRKPRKAKDILTVKRVFEFLLIDSEG